MFAGKDHVNPVAGRECVAALWRQAGITDPLNEIDVAEICVPFSWYEPMWLENLGFAAPGEGWRLAEAGETAISGRLPVNPSGGVLSSNPIGASGLLRFAESALQVMGGRCPPGGRSTDGAEARLRRRLPVLLHVGGIERARRHSVLYLCRVAPAWHRGRGVRGDPMSKLARVMAAAGRGAARLVPAGRRDWVAAVWAEADEVPPGVERLAWRAGGVWVLAREALLPRRIGRAALFAVAGAGAAWAAWPQPATGHLAEGRFNAIATVLLVVAVLPLLSRRFFGPPSPSRVARSLRVLCCAAVLALVSASVILLVSSRLVPTRPAYRLIWCIAQGWSNTQGCGGVPGRSSGGPTWQAEILVMLLITGYMGLTLFLTSRRAQIARSTLAIGVGTGWLFGVVMLAVDPLGFSKWATNPWLPGSDVDPLVALAWILLFGGPAAAAVLASRRCRGPDGTRPPHNVRIGQGIAAGVLANGTAAMFTATLGTGTTLLTVRSPWLLHWFTHGRHMTALATYRYELNTAGHAGGYVLMLMFFPVIGLIMSSLAAAIANPAPSDAWSSRPGLPITYGE